jgi:uncharacterized protein with HEPN domain
MKHDPSVFLKHIRDSITDIENYTQDVDLQSFLTYTNKEKQDAVVRRIEIIGEAVRNLPEDFRQEHPEVPWHQIAGMRHKLVHEYFGVDLELVWQVVRHDLGLLKKHVEELLKQPA